MNKPTDKKLNNKQLEIPTHYGAKTESSIDGYQLRKRVKPNSCTRKSSHIKNTDTNYVETVSSCSDSDVDYTPKSRSKRQPNIGLREPLQTRLKAQQVINET